jgi:hypothetical protein
MSGQDHKGQEPVNPRIFPLPPVVLLLFLAGGYGLQRFFPIGGGEPAIESVIAGNALMVLAFAIAALAARELARAQTAIRPGERAAALVQPEASSRPNSRERSSELASDSCMSRSASSSAKRVI